ncbi:MAG: hypothetical protein ABFR89_02570 [Actinomycetota bacterium]
MGIRQSEKLVHSEFKTNAEGWPTGGETYLNVEHPFFDDRDAMAIVWQDGIIGEGGQNGAFLEDVIEAARQRLRFFQANSKTRCRENAIALTHLETALAWLDLRTRNRTVQGVENSYEGHAE